jgi:catecholate siderophore receptor
MSSQAIARRFVYKPSTHGSFYFDYGTSFDPDAESLSLSVGLVNGNVKPEENETYEAGANGASSMSAC